MICLNLKAYQETVGDNAYKMADLCNSFLEKNPASKGKFCIAPVSYQLSDLNNKFPNLLFIAQHTDSVELGKTTGSLPAEALKAIGIEYTILNHSERRIYDKEIIAKIKFIENKGIKTIVCCENSEEAEYILQAKPYAIAYETKELIGTLKSVSTENPDIVSNFIKIVGGKSKAWIGAGIANGNDVRVGANLGAEGYIVATAFVKDPDPYQRLADLLSGLS